MTDFFKKNSEKNIPIYCFVNSKNNNILTAEYVNQWGQKKVAPFLSSDKDHIDSLKPFMKNIAREKGISIKLMTFSFPVSTEEYL